MEQDRDAVLDAARDRLRNMVIDVVPVFGFTVTFALTHWIPAALGIALLAGVAVAGYRLLRRESVWRALAVLAVVAVAGALAARTGLATKFYLPGLIVESAVAVVTPVALLFGWPLQGVAVGMITGEGTRWRRCAVRRRAFTRGTLVAYSISMTALAVKLSLFLTGQAVILGTVDVIMPFVLAGNIVLSWRVYRRAVGSHRCEIV